MPAPNQNPLENLRRSRPCFILDGALATELEARGAQLSDDLWSARILLEQPELIRRVHYDYFAAGADIAITASYQATYPGYARFGLDAAATAVLLRRSVELAQQARADFWGDHAGLPNAATPRRPFPLVAASAGPYGAFLADGSEYRGDYQLSHEELVDFHRPRLQTLLEAAPDLLACETIPCLREATALITLLEELDREHAELPGAWISFACRNAEELNSGESFVHAVATVAESPALVAIGVNCTAPEHVEGLLQRARAVTPKPLLVYPNSGEAWDSESHSWIAASRAPGLATYVPRWLAAGAWAIGGCCRTTPADIAQVVRAVQAHATGP